MTRIAPNQMFKKYGKVTYISINNIKQQIDLSIILHGEDEPVEIRIDKYAIKKNNYGTTFRVEELQSNRLWLHRLLNDVIVGTTLDVPPGEYSNIVEELLFDTKMVAELG